MLLLENKDFCEFVALLKSKKVRYLIVGGHGRAARVSAVYRRSDFWLATDPENAVGAAEGS